MPQPEIKPYEGKRVFVELNGFVDPKNFAVYEALLEAIKKLVK